MAQDEREEHARGLVDVQQEDQQQPDLDRHDQRVRDQEVCVIVERLGAREHHRVAGQVQDEIREQQQAGDADEELGADR